MFFSGYKTGNEMKRLNIVQWNWEIRIFQNIISKKYMLILDTLNQIKQLNVKTYNFFTF